MGYQIGRWGVRQGDGISERGGGIPDRAERIPVPIPLADPAPILAPAPPSFWPPLHISITPPHSGPHPTPSFWPPHSSSPPRENNIFTLHGQNSQKSHEETPFSSIRYSTSHQYRAQITNLTVYFWVSGKETICFSMPFYILKELKKIMMLFKKLCFTIVMNSSFLSINIYCDNKNLK